MLGFTASADFAEDKAPHTPCRHLDAGFGCGIHARLAERGYPGCVAYDCAGAGQLVTAGTFGGADWRGSPAVASAMFAAFEVARRLQELRWYLEQARGLAPAPLTAEVAAALAEVDALTRLGPDELAALDDGPVHERVVPLLGRVSERVRAALREGERPAAGPDRRGRPAGGRDRTGRGDGRRGSRGPGGQDLAGRDLTGHDLVGADLRGADLTGATLRGALLIGADLRAARLTGTDLIRADLRAADLRGADLSGALFLTRAQLGAARGDARTAVPAELDRPAAWDAST